RLAPPVLLDPALKDAELLVRQLPEYVGVPAARAAVRVLLTELHEPVEGVQALRGVGEGPGDALVLPGRVGRLLQGLYLLGHRLGAVADDLRGPVEVEAQRGGGQRLLDHAVGVVLVSQHGDLLGGSCSPAEFFAGMPRPRPRLSGESTPAPPGSRVNGLTA